MCESTEHLFNYCPKVANLAPVIQHAVFSDLLQAHGSYHSAHSCVLNSSQSSNPNQCIVAPVMSRVLTLIGYQSILTVPLIIIQIFSWPLEKPFISSDAGHIINECAVESG